MKIDYDKISSLIKFFEGYSYIPYLCPAGYWTIAWGHVIVVNGRQLKGDADAMLAFQIYRKPLKREEAEEIFRTDMIAFTVKVLALVKVPLNSNQMASLVSFAYNVGVGNFSTSTLLRKLNKGDYDCVPKELRRWVYGTVDGKRKKLNGLVNRREKEAEYWLRED